MARLPCTTAVAIIAAAPEEPDDVKGRSGRRVIIAGSGAQLQ